MATTTAKNTLQKVGDAASPEVFTTIGYVRPITGPSVSAVIQDGTTHSTSGNWMEKLAMLIDPGTMGFQILYDSADTTHAFTTGLWADLIALTLRNFTTTFPNSAGSLAYGAFLSSHGFEMPVDNYLVANIELAITGMITATNS